MRRAAFASVLAATALLGCGDDGEEFDAVPDFGASTTTSISQLEVFCGGDAGDVAPAIARTELADGPDVTWTPIDTRHGALGIVFVELEPEPADVGVPSLTLIFACANGQPQHLATYELEGGEYVFRSNTELGEDIDFAPVLED